MSSSRRIRTSTRSCRGPCPTRWEPASPVVSTPYAYAAEALADGRGVLVPPASPVALGALNELLGDPELRAAIGRRAYEYSRRMVWSSVGGEYRDLFAAVADPTFRSRSPPDGRRRCPTPPRCIPSAGGISRS